MSGTKNFTDDQIISIIEQHGNITAASRYLSIPRTTLQNRYDKILANNSNKKTKTKKSEENQVTITEKDDLVNLVCLMRGKTPAEDIVKQLGYDLRKWKIEKVKFNQWQVAGKRKLGQNSSGRWKADKLWKSDLYQVTIDLKLRAPKFIGDAIDHLMKNWSGPQKLPIIKRRNSKQQPHLLEISLFDAHFGKLAWAQETGQDYDLSIAEKIYLTAVDDLLQRSEVYNVDQIVFPLGQDFFNTDNWKGETANGTLVESTDDRMTKIFEVGVEAVKWALMRCREIAPTKVLWSPGNHDRSTSWYMCKTLEQYFLGAKAKDISFDLDANQRKYISYGNTLLGFTHSCDEKMSDLPLIMAKEEKKLWAEATYHQWHVGHFHKKKEMKFIAGDTFNGVSVVILPSLTATDSYHYRNGWVSPTRAAEAFLWSRDRGLSDTMIHCI